MQDCKETTGSFVIAPWILRTPVGTWLQYADEALISLGLTDR